MKIENCILMLLFVGLSPTFSNFSYLQELPEKILPNYGFKYKKKVHGDYAWLPASWIFAHLPYFSLRSMRTGVKKYKESTSDTQAKSNSIQLFFLPKVHRLKAQTLAYRNWPLILSSSFTGLLNIDTMLFFALSAGSLQLKR